MKVVVAVDSFKGSLSSVHSSETIANGIKDAIPDAEVVTLPLADGGEGTLETLVKAKDGSFIYKQVTGPLNEKVNAKYGIINDGHTAVIEVAAACGLPLIPNRLRDPMKTTSFGVGELIVDAIEKGCRDFIIGLGGSGTNDGGVGMLQALGYQFLNANAQEVGRGGAALKEIETITSANGHPKLKDCHFNVACDVENYLLGEFGASVVFGPQKGASEEMVKELDESLKNFSELVNSLFGREINKVNGAGAAGGLGAAFVGFLNTQLRPGIEIALEAINIEEHLMDTDFIVTGEGKLDKQTTMGKAPIGVARIGNQNKIPVIGVAGSVENDSSYLNENGFTACFSIMNSPMSLDKAMEPSTTSRNLYFTVNQIFNLLRRNPPA